ncbi:B12-binding domain/radical SAM domain-containing protein [Agrobacterium tumefaciens]
MSNIEQAKEASDMFIRPVISTPIQPSRYAPGIGRSQTVQNTADRPTLRVVAVAAPDSVQGKKGERALNSSDPASLYNACRIAASRARSAQGGWGNSNWADRSRAKVRENFLLLYSLDDLPAFVDVLRREQPNMLLLGAMTLCMPGAIECAKLAKEMFGNDIIVVLGGRHVTETVYIQSRGSRLTPDITHHRASPARLVREGRIPPVFDIVVSGDGEFVIAELGEIIAKQKPPHDMSAIYEAVDRAVPGDWIISFPSCSRELVSAGVPINSDALPPLAGLFGVSTAFDVFGGRMTAHVFSDTGRGCAYDCAFCSEKSGVTGGLRHLATAADRLYRQLEDVVAVIEEDYPGMGASAFVEDSILLGGSPRALDRLCDLLECRPLPIQFGAQFTVDQILNRERQIARLADVGMRYIFIGLETFDPKEIGGMSKDIGSKNGSWQDRATRVFQTLTNHRVSCGCALLFGLGESHDSRIALLDTIIESRQKTGCPTVISANWAVQHPLRGQSGGADFDYLSWGTPPGPYLDLFHHFGEASVNYPLQGQRPPEIQQIEEIVEKLEIFAHAITD